MKNLRNFTARSSNWHKQQCIYLFTIATQTIECGHCGHVDTGSWLQPRVTRMLCNVLFVALYQNLKLDPSWRTCWIRF